MKNFSLRKKFICLITSLLFTFNVIGQTDTTASYVNGLIGAGTNSHYIIRGDTLAWGSEVFDSIANAGFTSIRLNYIEGSYLYDLSVADLDLIQTVVDTINANGLLAMIDYHIANDWFKLRADESGQQDLFISNWGEIANRFSSYDIEDVVYQLCNEPFEESTGLLDWNALVANTITEIRLYDTAKVIVIPVVFYGSIRGVHDLELPAEEEGKLIMGIHYYMGDWVQTQNWPFVGGFYGMQSAGVDWVNIEPIVDNLENDFYPVYKWREDHDWDIPVTVDEWGSVVTVDLDNRIAYSRLITRWCESQEFSHAVWDWDQMFGIYYNPSFKWTGVDMGDDYMFFPGLETAITSDSLDVYNYTVTDVLIDADWSANTDGWTTYNNGGYVSINAIGGELECYVSSINYMALGARVWTPSIALEKGHIYRMSFTVYEGSGTRDGWSWKYSASVGEDIPDPPWYYLYNLTSTPLEYVNTFIYGYPTDYNTKIEFLLGEEIGRFYISSFLLEELTPDLDSIQYTLYADSILIPEVPEEPGVLASDTIWFEDYNAIHKAKVDTSLSCGNDVVKFESAFVLGGEEVTDTLSKINFCLSSYWDVVGWTSFYEGLDSVEIADGIYMVNNATELVSNYAGEDVTDWPLLVSTSYWYLPQATSAISYEIHGLHDTCTYNFYGISSRRDDVSPPRSTYMYIGAAGDTVESVGNTNDLLVIEDVTPSSGEVTISFDRIDNQYGYINGLIILETYGSGSTNDTTQAYVKFDTIDFGLIGYDSLHIMIDDKLSAFSPSAFITLDSLDGDTIAIIVSLGELAGCEIQKWALLDTITGEHDVYVTIDSLNIYSFILFKALGVEVPRVNMFFIRKGVLQTIWRKDVEINAYRRED